jgi:hypothetical protein
MIGLAGMLLAEPFLLKLLYARLLRDVSTAVTYRVTPWSMRSTPALAQVQYRSCFLYIMKFVTGTKTIRDLALLRVYFKVSA